jgi:hypothetical protein
VGAAEGAELAADAALAVDVLLGAALAAGAGDADAVTLGDGGSLIGSGGGVACEVATGAETGGVELSLGSLTSVLNKR